MLKFIIVVAVFVALAYGVKRLMDWFNRPKGK